MELAEKGLIGTLIVKDHSRLGRNRLIVGQLLEEGFDSLGVRYIAIMDNIDTAKGISDLVPMQDLFNEWHAKNTSQKVRNVFKSKGMSGAPLTTNPPFGYLKDPESKNGWIIDEAAAKTVRQIFSWCVDGLGPTQIAKRLKAAKVSTPTEHWCNIGRNCSKLPTVPYNWCSATVADILGKQEYCDDTVNFRSTTKSFKNKKKIDRPPEGWQIFKDTHPAIIDRETFALVQELRKHRRRPSKSGIPEMQAYLEAETDKTESLQRFIQKVKQVTELKALTPELIHEFVDKIVVYAPRYLDGKRVQLLDIYYSGVGILHELNPEEMEGAAAPHRAQQRENGVTTGVAPFPKTY